MDFAKALWRAAGGRAAALHAAAVAVAHLVRCSGGVLREALGGGAAVVERLQGDVGGEGEPPVPRVRPTRRAAHARCSTSWCV